MIPGKTQVGFWIPYGVLQTIQGSNQWRIPFALQLVPAGVSTPLADQSLESH